MYIGRLEGWKAGRLEGWRVGRLEGWKVGRLEGWKVGGLEAYMHKIAFFSAQKQPNNSQRLAF